MTLICGLPNAGKTTYSQRYQNVIHLDDFPRNKFLNCNAFVSTQDDCVVEGIYNLRCRRLRLLESYHGSAPRICIWIDTPLEERLKRETRGRPSSVINSGFQPPTLDEGWDEIIIVRNNYE